MKTDFQGVFETWTGRNVGLPMAIILNGEYSTAPRIISPLKDRVQVTLGERDWTAAEQRAKAAPDAR